MTYISNIVYLEYLLNVTISPINTPGNIPSDFNDIFAFIYILPDSLYRVKPCKTRKNTIIVRVFY